MCGTSSAAEPAQCDSSRASLGRLVGAEQANALGGITVALVAAVIPIGHVVFLPSNPPSMNLAPRWRRSAWWRDIRCRPTILTASPAQVVAKACSDLEQLLFL